MIGVVSARCFFALRSIAEIAPDSRGAPDYDHDLRCRNAALPDGLATGRAGSVAGRC